MNWTKKFLVFLLIFGMTVPKDVLVFAMDVPVIFQHFKHHQAYEQISFLDFVKEHSSDHNHPEQEKNHPDHNKLPFSHQHSTDCNQGQTLFVLCQDSFLNSDTPISTKVIIATKTSFIGTQYVNNIWQPPQFS